MSNALHDADLDEGEIHHVVLVGGCTFTPLVQTALETKFGKPVNKDVNPMEAGMSLLFLFLLY